jgi:hypothetical protein
LSLKRGWPVQCRGEEGVHPKGSAGCASLQVLPPSPPSARPLARAAKYQPIRYSPSPLFSASPTAAPITPRTLALRLRTFIPRPRRMADCGACRRLPPSTRCWGDGLTLLAAFAAAPASSSRSTTSLRPHMAAICRGVWPFCSSSRQVQRGAGFSAPLSSGGCGASRRSFWGQTEAMS